MINVEDHAAHCRMPGIIKIRRDAQFARRVAFRFFLGTARIE